MTWNHYRLLSQVDDPARRTALLKAQWRQLEGGVGFGEVGLEIGQRWAEIETGFKFNDAVLRHLTVLKDKAETAPSVMMKQVEREEARKAQQDQAAA